MSHPGDWERAGITRADGSIDRPLAGPRLAVPERIDVDDSGENLVWASPSLSAGGAMKLWISSPPHLANLLSHQWRQIGISAVGAARAPGVYGGKPVTIITTDFGVRH